jgi:hypothetical protein
VNVLTVKIGAAEFSPRIRLLRQCIAAPGGRRDVGRVRAVRSLVARRRVMTDVLILGWMLVGVASLFVLVDWLGRRNDRRIR